MRFTITASCVKCGACAEDCPMGIISRGDTQFHIGKGCIGCGDCYTICPVGAVVMVSPETSRAAENTNRTLQEDS